ncbi:adenosylhomocysteinase [Streptomyces luteolus]|uniref:Adenosylhomocysteinase n=1 Tax=Streptomyces luteolus TaxID=3043615 RepID=A0ABT6TAS4_9ACTN|nr:adenosylhomocysteinase [Streptomyces sp. B-S-A12]MDI3424119.1 adenosylhomocysteinase [Streptomyces sp. B-S-A12]
MAAHFKPANPPAAGFLITHLLPERPAFVRGIAAVTDLKAVLPKPKSIHEQARRDIERDQLTVDTLDRDLFATADRALAYLESHAPGQRVVLCDVGGYFTPTLTQISQEFTGEIIGVVEDTENGHKRYEDLGKLPCLVYSVARSPLKDPEDYLVGQSVVFSAEALMRGRGDILHGRTALVIGFGKLGSLIARLLHAKGVRVTVHDIDPVRRAQALSQGFTVCRDREAALKDAGLVLCATGALSLRTDDFQHLANGAYVATVTSSEDELELDHLADLYERTTVAEHVTRYLTTGHYFFLLNDGNAVNFIHGASVGPFIALVQAEIIAAVHAITNGAEPGLHHVTEPDRALIAATWLDYFNR